MADPLYNPWAAPVFPSGAAFGTGSPAETSQQPAGLSNFVTALYNSLGGMAQRAFGASEEMRQGGAYNPAPAVEAAMLPMGTGAVAGVPVKGAEAVLGAGPIRAYHGSPHDFDRFDLSKIGTGEGAQAYGHGLYFAENEGTAKSYRDALSKPVPTVNGRVQAAGVGKFNIVDDFGIQAGPFPTYEEARRSMMHNTGKMYEVNINADPAHFLDWDKPLSGQSDAVKQALKLGELPQKPSSEEAMAIFRRARELGVPAHSLPEYKALEARMDSANADAWNTFGINPSNIHARPEDLTGSQFVQGLEQKMLGPDVYGGKSPAASNTLREAGIPGIKYLDQGSRTAGEGSSNYVVFDDKLIDIMRKYGLAGLLGPPIFAQAAGEQK